MFKNWIENLFLEENQFIITEMAKKYNVNIAGGSYIRKIDNEYRNTCPIIDRSGTLCAMYDKIFLNIYRMALDIQDHGIFSHKAYFLSTDFFG